MLIGSAGAILVWFIRRIVPESPLWLAQNDRGLEADRIVTTLESKIAREYGQTLPEPVLATIPTKAVRTSLSEVFRPPYRSRLIMLVVFNLCQVIGYYGFANWVPSLLVAMGIEVTKGLAYSAIKRSCIRPTRATRSGRSSNTLTSTACDLTKQRVLIQLWKRFACCQNTIDDALSGSARPDRPLGHLSSHGPPSSSSGLIKETLRLRPSAQRISACPKNGHAHFILGLPWPSEFRQGSTAPRAFSVPTALRMEVDGPVVGHPTQSVGSALN